MSANDIFTPVVLATPKQLETSFCLGCQYRTDQKEKTYFGEGRTITAKEDACTGFGENPVVKKGNFFTYDDRVIAVGTNKGEDTIDKYPFCRDLRNGRDCPRFTPQPNVLKR